MANEEQLKVLVDKAIEAKEFSYSPYSKFRVGCALVTNDDTIYNGNKTKIIYFLFMKHLFDDFCKKKAVMLRMHRMV